MGDRAAWIQWLLKDLDRLEAMAAAAQPSEVHHSGWAGLSSESGLTEAQGGLVDHWSPQRVIRTVMRSARCSLRPRHGPSL
jgi:hypothetical protein